ncbi:hypothetical protein SDC9_106987 [bioreactor metagenome]|uniref:Uncharacterized protein n=1 Tax=bioreactor metagenome TaxID=1076179 RepID=A0A645B3U6_9ZZZZ
MLRSKARGESGEAVPRGEHRRASGTQVRQQTGPHAGDGTGGRPLLPRGEQYQAGDGRPPQRNSSRGHVRKRQQQRHSQKYQRLRLFLLLPAPGQRCAAPGGDSCQRRGQQAGRQVVHRRKGLRHIDSLHRQGHACGDQRRKKRPVHQLQPPKRHRRRIYQNRHGNMGKARGKLQKHQRSQSRTRQSAHTVKSGAAGRRKAQRKGRAAPRDPGGSQRRRQKKADATVQKTHCPRIVQCNLPVHEACPLPFAVFHYFT